LGDAEQMIVKAVPRIDMIAAADWDACANPDPETHNPFLSHTFLNALEESGTVGPGTGWMPHHLVLEDQCGVVAWSQA
jgi:predicted N-acyltransferase